MKIKFFIFIFAAIFFATSLIIFTSTPFISSISEFLVHEDKLEPAEAIVVLSGSGTGNRVEAASELFSKGFGKVMIFSGVQLYPGFYQYTLMKDYAINLGVPENKIIAKKIVGENSTWGEGIFNLKLLKENNIKSFILVTSAFHTRRAHAVYEKLIAELGYEFKYMVYPAKDPLVPIKGWWGTRRGKNIY